jgi:hypothetical protein
MSEAAPEPAEGEAADLGRPAEPTPEQVAARAARANKALLRALAAVLCLEAFCVLLVPRAIAQTSVGLSGTKTALLIAFAVVLVGAGAVLRRPIGIALGTALQLPMFAVGIWVHGFLFVAAIFLGVWIYLLNLRHELVGTPGGLRMLIS